MFENGIGWVTIRPIITLPTSSTIRISAKALQSSPNIIFRFSMLSESAPDAPLPRKASLTIAVFRF